MKKGIILFIFLFFGFSSLIAQEGVEIFGYFESQASGTAVNNELLMLYSNKLRVDLRSILSDKDYNLNDWMRLLTTEQKAISRDQIYSFIQHPATDLPNIGLSIIYSLSDKSVALVQTLNYSLSDNVEIFTYLNFNFGKEGKAFSKTMGNGGLLRARVYF
jgi:hypothetical protein